MTISEQTLMVRSIEYNYTYVHHMHYAFMQEESESVPSPTVKVMPWQSGTELDIEYQQAQLKYQATVKQLYYLLGAFN